MVFDQDQVDKPIQNQISDKLYQCYIALDDFRKQGYFLKKAEIYSHILNKFSLVYSPVKCGLTIDKNLEKIHKKAKRLVDFSEDKLHYLKQNSANESQKNKAYKFLLNCKCERNIYKNISEHIEMGGNKVFITFDMLETLKQLKEIYSYFNNFSPSLVSKMDAIENLLNLLSQAIAIIENKLEVIEKWRVNLPDQFEKSSFSCLNQH